LSSSDRALGRWSKVGRRQPAEAWRNGETNEACNKYELSQITRKKRANELDEAIHDLGAIAALDYASGTFLLAIGTV